MAYGLASGSEPPRRRLTNSIRVTSTAAVRHAAPQHAKPSRVAVVPRARLPRALAPALASPSEDETEMQQNPDSDEEGGHSSDSDVEHDRRAWAERKARESEAWAQACPDMQADSRIWAAAIDVFQYNRAQAVVTCVQQGVLQLCSQWCDTHLQECAAAAAKTGVGLEAFTHSDQRELCYVGLLGSGTVNVRQVICLGCRASFTPGPVQLGCFPSSPKRPVVWYDLNVLQMYEYLGIDSGLSMTDFVDQLEHRSFHQRAADGGISRPPISTSQFASAWYAYLRANAGLDDFDTLEIEGLDHGPFADCPICCVPPPSGGQEQGAGDEGTGQEGAAATPTPTGREHGPANEGAVQEGAAVSLPLPPLAVSLDACTKLSHYANCGTAFKDDASAVGAGYYGHVDQRVTVAHAEGKLSLSSTLADPGAVEEAACQSSLHCSRPDASTASGMCDVLGLCGGVCMHSFPLRGAFCDMPTHEQFCYYLFMLDYLVGERPDLQHVYIDFGCRISSTWQRYCEAHSLSTDARQIQIMVNWMHAGGHDVGCQLRNSGRHRAGAGRRIGEEVEQLWSMLKPGGSLVRYMTHAHRRDFIEVLLKHVSRSKLRVVVKLVEQRYKEAQRVVAEAEQAMHALVVESKMDMEHLQSAAQEYERSVLSDSPGRGASPEAWQMDYISVLLRERQAAEVQSKAAAMAVLSSTSAVALAAASTPAELDRLRKQLAKMERQHGIEPWDVGVDWVPGAPQFDAALGRLKEREVRRCRAHIESLVLEIRRLYTERAAAGVASKATKQNQNRAKRKRTQVRAALQEVYVWQQLGESVPAERVTEEQLQTMFASGRAPWASEADGVAAERLYFGSRFHAAWANASRGREELPYLSAEKGRLRVWLSRMENLLSSAHALKQASCPGTAFLIARRLAEVRLLAKELSASAAPG